MTSTSGPAGNATRSLLVAMLTFRRPDDLREAVPAFAREAAAVGGALLVVDNDPDGSARSFVEGLGNPAVRYVHEPRPGIAAARNRALDECRADLLVFVDDDERPVPGWLPGLLHTFDEHAPVAVAGAVVSEYDEPLTAWMAAGRFFDRRRLPTGTPVQAAATNNLLLDMRWVRNAGVRFDEAFGLSGGSDTLFTRTLHQLGALMVWSDDAVVVDVVPPARLTPRWVLHRARRSGNSASRVEVAMAPAGRARTLVRLRQATKGLLRVCGGGARVGLGFIARSQQHDARGRRAVARGLGMIGGAFGHVVYEYRRS